MDNHGFVLDEYFRLLDSEIGMINLLVGLLHKQEKKAAPLVKWL